MPGECAGRVGAQFGWVHAGVPGGNGVGDQAFVAGGVLAGDDGYLTDSLVRGQYGFDFAQFDPEASDLDLVVGASQVFQVPVAVPAHCVPGAVHPFTRGVLERAGHEPLCGQARAPQIATGELASREVQLACYTH